MYRIIWRTTKVNGSCSKLVHCWPHYGIYKAALYLKDCKQTTDNYKQILRNWKKVYCLSNEFLALPLCWVKIAPFQRFKLFTVVIFQMKLPTSYWKDYIWNTVFLIWNKHLITFSFYISSSTSSSSSPCQYLILKQNTESLP